jgi:DNA repair ATPase RecN
MRKAIILLLTALIISITTSSALAATYYSDSLTDYTNRNKAEGTESLCRQTAIDQRDTTILTAIDKFASDLKNSITTRKEALKNAASLTVRSERYKATNKAWEEFRTSWKRAGRDLNSARNTAWRDYRNYMRNKCREIPGSDETATMDMLTNG